MGSLSASGIPVPTKIPDSYRKYDRLLIKSTDNKDDSITTVVTQGLEARTIGSGSIVRDDNMNPATVDYYEEISWGLYQGARSTSQRIASDSGAPRDLRVTRASPPIVVLPSGDSEYRDYHTGDNVVLTRPSGDVIVARIPSSGAFD